MASFLEKYIESQTDISQWAPYCFFHNGCFGERKFTWHIYQMKPKGEQASRWFFQLTTVQMRLLNGRSPSVGTESTDDFIGKTHEENLRARDPRDDGGGYLPRIRSQLFINLYILFHHWAKHQYYLGSHVATFQDVIQNEHEGRDLMQVAPYGSVVLSPSIFTLVACFRDWARLFPLQFRSGHDWRPQTPDMPPYYEPNLDCAACMLSDLRDVLDCLLADEDFPMVEQFYVHPITQKLEYQNYPHTYNTNTLNRNPLDIGGGVLPPDAQRQAIAREMLQQALLIAFDGLSDPEQIVARAMQPHRQSNNEDKDIFLPYEAEEAIRYPLPPTRPADEPEDVIHDKETWEAAMKERTWGPQTQPHQTPSHRNAGLQTIALNAMIGVSFDDSESFHRIVGPHLQRMAPRDLAYHLQHMSPRDLAQHNVILIEGNKQPNVLMRFHSMNLNDGVEPASILRIPDSIRVNPLTTHCVYRLRDRVLRVSGIDPRNAIGIALGSSRVYLLKPFTF